ncbi:MAG: class I SAM-dependent methyltransferase [Planctomycetales bacterium]|nr:class I SAM-dependent methyltransferase [Planctomycetales bacterium]
MDNSAKSFTLVSVFGLLLQAAEHGYLPDFLVRTGIRRLLRARRYQSASQHKELSLDTFVRATQAQPIAVAPQKANEQHYEVPAEFFCHVLGQRLKYSCCYWLDTTTSLNEAEEEALRRTCENAQLEDGMDILELGCGWGSLSIWMAERYPKSRITVVSNSNSQRLFIERKGAELGLSNLTVITADMNDFKPNVAVDRVVSVEMFEHMRNHRRLMDNIHDWLRPGGKLLVHIFCHKNSPYLFHSDGDINWMGRHFFSGGMMPSVDLLPRCGSRLALAKQWHWNGMHYAKTCRAWLANQDESLRELRDVLTATYGEESHIWHNRWRIFFMACEELFAFDHGEEWFVTHSLFEKCTQN